MRYLTLALLFLALPAHAATLVLTQAHGYQLPANADVVKVLRTPVSVWAPIATVLPTERIQICVVSDAAPEVAIGSTTSCPTRIPGRTDNWQLKSLVFAAPPPKLGTVSFKWNAVTKDTDDAPMAITGYRVTIRRQNCEIGAVAGCTRADSDPPVDVAPTVLTFTVQNVAYLACPSVQALSPTGVPGRYNDEVCLPAKMPEPIPAMVTGITAVSP